MRGPFPHAFERERRDDCARRHDPARLQFRHRHPLAQSRRRTRRQGRLYRRPRRHHLRRAGGAGRALWPCAAHAQRAQRGAGADLPHRHHRLADRLPRRHQGRRRRGAGQHAAHRRRLLLHAGRLPRPRLGRVRRAAAEVRQGDRRQQRPRPCCRVRRQCPRPPALRRAPERRQDRRRDRDDDARRHVLLALHLGLDGEAQGRRAYPRRSETHRRSLCRAHSRDHRERRLLLGGKIVLRLRSRQRADFPDVGRRHHRAAAAPADAGPRRRNPKEASDHHLLRGADVLCRVLGQPGGATARRAENPPLRLGRRSAAARRGPAVERSLRHRRSRRHRLDRDAAHFLVEPRRRRQIRHQRQADRRLRSALGRRRRQNHHRARRDGRVAGARPDQRHDVLEQPRAVSHHVPRRMDALGRQVYRGRRRLLRLLRPP